MLKFSKRSFNTTWTKNFQMFKLDLEKAEEPEIKLPTTVGKLKKEESSTKALLLLYWRHQILCVVFSPNCRKFLKRWEYQTTWPASWESCIQVKKQQLELGMEQHTGSKLGKTVHHDCILSPCLLTYAEYKVNAGQDESQAGIKIARRNINNLR